MGAVRNNGNLPKALVKRLGESVVRNACGLGPLTQKTLDKRNAIINGSAR